MQMTGEQRIAAPRQQVWEALNDPAVLAACIPSCQSLEKEGEDRFNAVAEVRIGPIGARFKGSVTLGDLDPANGYTITGQGNGGIAGSAKGSAKVRLSDDAGGTLVSYAVDAEVGGRMAQLGGPIIDATAKQLAGKFFSKFGEIVGANEAGEAVDVAARPAAAAVAAPLPSMPPEPLPTATFPWAWAAALGLAILTGFLLGRSDAADWWVVAVAVLALVAAGAGFDAGRRSGDRT
jgi:carbon monoxide dehydrogenase subunit G